MAGAIERVRGLAGARAWPVPGQLLSLAFHLGLLAAAALASPTLSAPAEEIAEDPWFRPSFYPVRAPLAEMELDEPEKQPFAGGWYRSGDGSGAALADESEAKVGSRESHVAAGRSAQMGPADNAAPGTLRRGLRDEASCCLIGPFQDPSGSTDGLPAMEAGIGDEPRTAAAGENGSAPADAAGKAGAAPSGDGTGSRPLACTPGLGVGRGPVQRARPGAALAPTKPGNRPSGQPPRAFTPARRGDVRPVTCD